MSITDYEKFVRTEYNSIVKAKFSEYVDGQNIFISSAETESVNVIGSWFVNSIFFLNNAKNKRYVILLMLLLDCPKEKALYRRCKIYHKIMKDSTYPDNSLFATLNIASFKYDAKIHVLLSVLKKRLLVVKNGDRYFPNLRLFSTSLYLRRTVRGKSYDLVDMLRKNMKIARFPTLIVNDYFLQRDYNPETLAKLFSYIDKFELNIWERILALEKFDFVSLYLTWYNLFEDVEILKRDMEDIFLSEDEKKSKISDEMKHSLFKSQYKNAKVEKKFQQNIVQMPKKILEDYLDFLRHNLKDIMEIMSHGGKSFELSFNKKLKTEILKKNSHFFSTNSLDS